MTTRPTKPTTIEDREALTARVRARFTRTLEHLRHAFAGRETEWLYSVEAFQEEQEPIDIAGIVAETGQPLTLPSWRPRAPGTATRNYFLTMNGEEDLPVLPPAMTIADGFARLDADAEPLIDATVTDVFSLIDLVPRGPLRAAVLAREKLVRRWPWPRHRHPAARVLDLLLLSTEGLPDPDDLAPGAWPPEVAPLDVAQWDAWTKAHPDRAAQLLFHVTEQARTRPGQGPAAMAGFILSAPQWTAIAVLYAVLQEVEEASRQALIRLSATKPSRAVISVLGAGRGSRDTDYPWRDFKEIRTEGLAELVWDGRRDPVQLRLNLADDLASLNYVAVRGILDKLHEDGLRDWLILHRMAGEQGATGTICWTWADHKTHTPDARRVTLGKTSDAELEAAAWHRLWTLKRAEIRLYAERPLPDGSTPWERVGPWGLLDIPAGTRDPQGRDRLAVIELNPEIYAGAKRNAPSPHFLLLAKSAVRLPGDALRLALFLACDWQYERAADGLIRTAATLWDYAAIRDRDRTPRKYWPAIEHTLERLLRTLAEKGHLGDWRHDGGQGAERRYHLDPPQWWKDQVIHGVSPVFGKSLAETPKTGAELKTWRKDKRGWSLTKLAGLAGVSRTTLYEAEREPQKPLSPRLVARLRPL